MAASTQIRQGAGGGTLWHIALQNRVDSCSTRLLDLRRRHCSRDLKKPVEPQPNNSTRLTAGAAGGARALFEDREAEGRKGNQWPTPRRTR